MNIREENTKTIFDLREQSYTDLDRLEMGLNSGIQDCKEVGLNDVEQTLHAFRLIVKMAKQIAKERESKEWVECQLKDILKNKN